MTTSLFRRTAVLAAVASLMLLLAGVSSASALTHPKLLGPKRGTVFPVGSRPTFTMKDTSRAARSYRTWITISNAKKFKKSGTNKGDLLKTKIGDFSDFTRHGSTFTYTPPAYNFPTWYMVVPGKYYWQAYHIDCSQKGFRCHVHSKLSSFYVR